VKTFYSAADIEQLASQGVHELAVDDDTVLTAVAREVAARLGVRLVTPGQRQAGATVAPSAPAADPLRPRGCQRGPAQSGPGPTGTAGPAAGGHASQVVGDLIGAVKQLVQRS